MEILGQVPSLIYSSNVDFYFLTKSLRSVLPNSLINKLIINTSISNKIK